MAPSSWSTATRKWSCAVRSSRCAAGAGSPSASRRPPPRTSSSIFASKTVRITCARALATLLLACAVGLIAVPAQAQSQPQQPGHEVRRGDTLFGVARKLRHEGVNLNQMVLSIWRANQGAFPGGNINQLEVGTTLAIPTREAVAAIEPAEAARQVRELLAKASTPAPQQVAAVKPAVAAVAPAAPRSAAPVGQEQAAKRYRDGLALEQKGDDAGALKAFLDAGEAGHGLAQRKLGQIYDKGNTRSEE